jgi:WD40 repeat protein
LLKNLLVLYYLNRKIRRKKNLFYLGHTSLITSIRLTHNSKYLVSSSTDHTVKSFNLNSGELENSYS